MHHFPILNTKLYKPDVKDHYVFRKQIIEELEENRSKPLTLVAAATGYGKSVAISEWLDFTKAKHCWVSLDDELNDLRLFLAHIIFGIKYSLPDSFPELSEILAAAELPNEKILSNYFINELDEIGEELILVLDDYHLISNRQIHNVLDELLKYCPRKFHLVIITRRDPPLKINTLKSYGAVNEIRMSELSFTPAEIVTLANKLTHLKLSEKLVKDLLEKTEGWVIGLRLALLTMTEEKDLEKAIEEIGGDKHYFTQYLLDEVFLHQAKEVQEILLIASIFDRFNKELLKFVIENRPSINENTDYSVYDNLFDRFKNSSLFIIPLDSNGEWFRFHHFFKDFLLNQLKKKYSKEEIIELHKKASEYFYIHNLFEEALSHAAKSSNIDLIVKIFKENKYHLLDSDKNNILWNWLHILPEEIITKELHVLLTRALLFDEKGDFSSMQSDLVIADELLGSDNINNSKEKDRLLGEYYAIKSLLSYISGDTNGSMNHFNKSIKLLTYDQFLFRDVALAYGAFSNNSSNRPAEAVSILIKNLNGLPSTYILSRTRNMILLSMLYAFQGKLNEIMPNIIQSLPVLTKNKLWVTFSLAIYYLVEVNYQWNKLDSIIENIEQVETHKHIGRPFWKLNCLYTKAFTLNAQGDYQALELTLLELNSFANDYDSDLLKMAVKVCEVEISLRRNSIEKALSLSEGVNFDIYPPIFFFYFPQLTHIKLLFSTADPVKMDEAQVRLEKLIDFAQATYRQNLLVQSLSMQAFFYAKKDNKQRAIDILKESLRIAEPGGFIRSFIDLGDTIGELIEEIHKNDSQNIYLTNLKKAFEEEENRKKKLPKMKSDIYLSTLFKSEKLSAREIELLKFVAIGMRNKEIADKMHLSVDSIKKYLYYIYQKLDVSNRVAATMKATDLGLINQLDNIQ